MDLKAFVRSILAPPSDGRDPKPRVNEAELSPSEFCERFLGKIRGESHPGNIALELNIFIARGLRHGYLTLYESYLLNMERLRFLREFNTDPAFNRRIRITNLLELMNQRHLAIAFGDGEAAQRLLDWALEAKALNKEKRPHSIADRYEEFLDPDNLDAMKCLSELRDDYDSLSDDLGPFPIESYPFHFFASETLATDEEARQEAYTMEVRDDVRRILEGLPACG